MPPEVCKNIRSNRKRIGLTQAELGEALGLQKSAIQKYESGATDIKVNTLYKMAEIKTHHLQAILDAKDASKSTKNAMRVTYGLMFEMAMHKCYFSNN